MYSHVHLDEIRRSRNGDALGGMRKLRAGEIEDVLNERFQSTGRVMLQDYVEPDIRYQRHLDAVAGCEDAGNSLTEILLRLFGADNFEELSLAPGMLSSEIDRLTAKVNSVAREELLGKTHRVTIEMKHGIEKHMKERRSLDQVRGAVGLTSEDRSAAAQSASPIDSLWEPRSSRMFGRMSGFTRATPSG